MFNFQLIFPGGGGGGGGLKVYMMGRGGGDLTYSFGLKIYTLSIFGVKGSVTYFFRS